MEALFTDAAGVAGRPYVLDGEILVAVPISREEAVPTGQVLDRIGCAAFEAWIGERMATYTVAVDDDPFGASQPRASPTPMAPAIPTVEPMPTPPVITIPGQGTEPTPVGEPFARPTVP
jgi:hypothetical protein